MPRVMPSLCSAQQLRGSATQAKAGERTSQGAKACRRAARGQPRVTYVPGSAVIHSPEVGHPPCERDADLAVAFDIWVAAPDHTSGRRTMGLHISQVKRRAQRIWRGRENQRAVLIHDGGSSFALGLDGTNLQRYA